MWSRKYKILIQKQRNHVTHKLQCLSKALIRPSSLWLFRTLTRTCVFPFTALYRIDIGPDAKSGASPAVDIATSSIFFLSQVYFWFRFRLIRFDWMKPQGFDKTRPLTYVEKYLLRITNPFHCKSNKSICPRTYLITYLQTIIFVAKCLI